MKSFADLKLSPKSLHALEKAGFEHPTPIQVQAIPPALAGEDVIGTRRDRHRQDGRLPPAHPGAARREAGTRALVLAPTRELAVQIGEELERFGKGRHVRGAVVIGGVGMGAQTQAFRERREVVVATPGPPRRSPAAGHRALDEIEILVLDEADRMLDMGFKPQLTRILARLPKARQTLLFSATMAGEVADFARAHLRDPVRVEVARSGTTSARAEQRVFLAGHEEKLPLLLALLEGNDLSTLVFTRTKRRADRVAKSLERAGHAVTRIHADRSQGQRRAALDGFKDGTLPRPRRDRHRRPRHRRGRDRPRGELRPAARARGLRPPHRPHRPQRGERPSLQLRLARGARPPARASRSSPGRSSRAATSRAPPRCSWPSSSEPRWGGTRSGPRARWTGRGDRAAALLAGPHRAARGGLALESGEGTASAQRPAAEKTSAAPKRLGSWGARGQRRR